MSCLCEGNNRMFSVEKMRDIAKKTAKLENSIFVLIKKEDGTISFIKDGETYKGVFIEYIYP